MAYIQTGFREMSEKEFKRFLERTEEGVNPAVATTKSRACRQRENLSTWTK